MKLAGVKVLAANQVELKAKFLKLGRTMVTCLCGTVSLSSVNLSMSIRCDLVPWSALEYSSANASLAISCNSYHVNPAILSRKNMRVSK